tara:strand:+ start:11596 stop:12198 length:603 start_codon:yes stop_codon:yes gene_type:complete
MLFTPIELLDIVIISLAIGYIFKDFIKVKHHAKYHEDPIKFYQQNVKLSNFKMAVMITAPTIILHELGHKFMAISFGMIAQLKAAYGFLGLGVLLKLLNFGFIFFVPAYVSWGCPSQECVLVLQQNPWIGSLIAFAGPLLNGILWLICYFAIKSSYIKPKYKPMIGLTKRINGFLFVFNLLPIPMFDGWHVVSGLVRSII